MESEKVMSTDIPKAVTLECSNESENELCQDIKSLPKSPSKMFTKTILKQGQGFLRPYMESVCILNIVHKTNNYEMLDQSEYLKELKIPLGNNLELILGSAKTEAVRILEKCILTMRKGEESAFLIKYVSNDMEVQKQNSSFLLIVTLHNFSETKPTWSLTSEEKYQLALQHKEKGTYFFKDGKIEAAFCQYSIAIIYLICITECTLVVDEKLNAETKRQTEIYKTLICICYLNLAACQINVGSYHSVINNCTHALALDRTNIKGLYRRAQAYLACGKTEEARSDLKTALEIEPKNRAIVSLLQSCKH